MSWKDIIKGEVEDEEVNERLDELEALYYELEQLNAEGLLDSEVTEKIKQALSVVHRTV
tara:strand:- start:13532 stop:13708 length:177 start_codon:yes stop_codon:yes gene_type:complete